MFEQGNLFDDIPEARFWRSVWEIARNRAKKSTPYKLDDETVEEYKIILRDNTRLELADVLRRIANDIEKKTLSRQKKAIDALYSKESSKK